MKELVRCQDAFKRKQFVCASQHYRKTTEHISMNVGVNDELDWNVDASIGLGTSGIQIKSEEGYFLELQPQCFLQNSRGYSPFYLQLFFFTIIQLFFHIFSQSA